jgi:hypothetical protein
MSDETPQAVAVDTETGASRMISDPSEAKEGEKVIVRCRSTVVRIMDLEAKVAAQGAQLAALNAQVAKLLLRK